MTPFHPNILNYDIIVDPELDDFLDAEYIIILPKEREQNFVFVDKSEKLPDQILRNKK